MSDVRPAPFRLRSLLAGIVPTGRADTGVADRLLTSFHETERTGLMLASVVRAVIIVALVLVFAVTGSFVGDGYGFLMAMPLGLALIGLAQFETARRWPHLGWPKYVFIALDCAYLAFVLIARHAFAADLPPVTLAVKEGALLFFVAFLVHGAFSYSPRFIVWTGFCITVAWGAVVMAAASEPGAFFTLGAGSAEDMWRRYGDPLYVPVIKIVYDYIVIALLTAGLAVAVWRSRQLVLAAAVSERARANLARHFSPKVVDVLSAREHPFGEVRRQAAAVLFADIRGFTTRCETMAPEEAMAFLRDFHARMEVVIFEHGGTLDKILGDGLLAVFGVPDLGKGDAGDALACGYAMIEAVAAWNAERAGSGVADVEIGVGLHYGFVMLGDVGSERLMNFTVVGDTVNVASRLQSLSKELGTRLVASQALVSAVKDEMRKEGALLDDLKFVGAKHLRGRETETVVYAFDGASTGAAGRLEVA
ncbi:MAG: adenylate/guanylate cyclase domain-containing protein [Alphaproteobacteria bacterium]|nr:adenylate/guanylate cyclase domain-containing protein [Alphaproteobacteria bacterium]